MCAAINILFRETVRRWSVNVRINNNQLELIVRNCYFERRNAVCKHIFDAICQTCCAGCVLAVTCNAVRRISADRDKLEMSETPLMTDECTLPVLTSEYIALTVRNQRAFHISQFRAIVKSISKSKATNILWACCGHAIWVENSTMPRTTSRLQSYFKNQTNQM